MIIKKNLPEPKIHNRKGDLSKRWFVEYYDDKGKKRRRYKPLSNYHTLESRTKAAERLLLSIKKEEQRNINFYIFKKIEQHFQEREHTFAKKTYQTYTSKLHIIKDYFLGINFIDRANVLQFLDNYLLIKLKRSNTTYNHYLIFLKMILRIVDQEVILDNIKKKKASPIPATFFTTTQMNFLMRKIEEENPTLAMFAKIMCYCALRNGREVPSLRVGDILIDEASIKVENQASKNGKRRFAAIPDVFLEELEAYIVGRPPNEYLFHAEGDKMTPIGKNQMPYNHQKILKKYGFDTTKYKLYSWRHTGAYLAYRAGASIKEIQIQFDHHCISQTDQYLRQLGIKDLNNYKDIFPKITK